MKWSIQLHANGGLNAEAKLTDKQIKAVCEYINLLAGDDAVDVFAPVDINSKEWKYIEHQLTPEQ